jgi:hypothetical protein
MYQPTMMMSSPLLRGPASEALERATKKRRTTSSGDNQVETSTSFDLAAMFDSIPPEADLDFPSISWDFDDEPEPVLPSRPLSEMQSLGKKRTLYGIVRSKAFTSDLPALCSEQSMEESRTKVDESAPTLHSSAKNVGVKAPRQTIFQSSRLMPSARVRC